ncbi:type II toxin-antitoxin system Phd/YefM family antitoxin [Glycomyces buryatensis]|uniref:Type II toxin-antitoxin system prevent-host-death family antitoxin n=1 Tax=Glycomyces buryatensis TaxID=2570927 RepID=A0A4S8QFD7_9ACTN|nr:type II toxin-antitoxin system prevent-host-death family antitoxin [Glycomyces buryatensis]THV41842.1 type II toxin-antitoxin system prevent-host-death family antitoxin [Glycomyces buryatensis]
METMTQREFRNNFVAIMTSVENGESYVITRNGVEIADVTPHVTRRKVTKQELLEACRKLPRVDYAEMRRDIDEFFGENRLGDDDPWERAGT